MNKLLMEENERLQKQVSQLVHENAYMKQQLQNVILHLVFFIANHTRRRIVSDHAHLVFSAFIGH
jgi:hypothetical protein